MRIRDRFTGRTWSIRSRILTLLLAPLLPLVGMWAFTANATLGSALSLLNAETNETHAGRPAVALVAALQVERQQSTMYLSQKVKSGGGALTQARASTDAATATFDRLTGSSDLKDAASALTKAHLAATDRALGTLAAGRSAIDRGQTDRAGTMALYNGIIDAALGVYGSISGLNDQDLARRAATVVALTSARELLQREDALLAGVLAGGSMTGYDLAALIQTIGAQRVLYQQATRYLSATDEGAYQGVHTSAAYTALAGMEDRIVAVGRAGTPAPVDAGQWRTDFDVVNAGLSGLESTVSDEVTNATGPAALNVLVRLGVAGVLGLVLIILLIVLSARIARGLIRRIAQLRQAALDLAEHKLPLVVLRLRRGEPVDPAEQMPPLAPVDDELGALGDALALVQRTAISSAVTEADLRTGMNQVFLNIARRSQTLLHRQLSLLDAMERRSTDPAELEELFRVDHLATRMRRHAEDLVILAGATPGRGWRNPVPIADVLRAAVAEIEEYARVSVRPAPEAALVGRAVGDVVHLLAELVENATTFSPPETQVVVTGKLGRHGLQVEVEDRGLGMPEDAIQRANHQLADPPEFDPAHSARLGLFVVARLAARHGIQVALRRSPHEGVTAVVLVPTELVIAEGRTGATAPAIGAAPVEVAQRVTSSVPLIAGPGAGPLEQVGSAEIVPAAPVSPAVLADADDSRFLSPTGDSAGGLVSAGESALGRDRSVQSPAAFSGLTADGLPQRIRQASLLPALAQSLVPDDLTESTTPRPPESTRTLLTSLQDGTKRGRRDASSAESDDATVPPAQAGEADPATPSTVVAGTVEERQVR